MSDNMDNQFVVAPIEVGGVALRPLSWGTWNILKKMDSFFVGGESTWQDGVADWIFSHGADIKDVLKASVDREAWRLAAEAFVFGMGVIEVVSLSSKIQEQISMAEKSSVEVESDGRPGK